MHPRTRLPLLAALALTLTVPADAQPAKARPDPADAQAAVAPLAYRTSLADYRKATDAAPPTASAWRDANDTVERIGGWRAYAREAAASAAAASAPAGPRR